MTLAVMIALAMAGTVEPHHYALKSDLDVWDVAVADINGDGKKDLLAFCSDENSNPLKKKISVYMAQPDGSYPPTPSASLPLDPWSGAAFTAEVDGKAPKELVVTNPEGAEVYSFQNGRFIKTASPRFNSLLPGGSREPRFLPNAAKDLDGDGIDEWLIPVPQGYEVRNADGLRALATCDVISEVRPAGTSGTLSISHRLPEVKPFKVKGEKQEALAFLTDEFADFAHGLKWSEHTRFKIPINLKEKWDTNAQMHDISGNGLPDLVVTQTEGTLNVKVLTQIYLAQEPFKYPEKPSATFETKGAFATPVVMDVNGDKKLDMLYLKVPFGLSFFFNLILRKKVRFNVEVYLFDKGAFPEKPDYTTSLTIDAPDGRQQVAYTLGDFNGDGRVDAAFGSGEKELEIHLGEERRLISNKAWKVFDVSPFGEARTYKLNDNKSEDIVIFHTSGEFHKTIDVMVF